MRGTIRSDHNRGNHLSHLVIMAAAASALATRSGMALAGSAWTGPAGTTSAPTSGTWSSAANWSPAGVPAGGASQELDFLGASNTYTATDDISGTFPLNLLVLGDAGGTIASAVNTNVLSFQGTSPTINQTTTGLFIVSAPVDLPANTAVTQVNGGEIDFTGPVTSSASSGLTLTNLTGTGNSTVKLFGANTFSALTVNPNVTAVSAQSASSTTLGTGTVTLAGGTLSLQGYLANGVVQHPIGVTGFNADTILDAAASTTIAANPALGIAAHAANATATGVGYVLPGNSNGAVYTSSANVVTSDITTPGGVHNSTVFFQTGWNGKTDGLPASGTFNSLYTNSVTGGHTGFDFAYNGTSIAMAQDNTLYFTANSSTGGTVTPASGTLALASPSTSTSSLDFLAAAELPKPNAGPTEFDVTLNFSDGSTDTYTQAISTGPLGDDGATDTATNVALGVYSTSAAGHIFGTDNGNSNHTDNGAEGLVFTESDIALTPADQAKTITSITFTPDSLNGSVAAIYAVSGVGSATNVLQGTQTYANNVAVTANSTINVGGSLQATVGNLNIGSNTLSVASSDTTASPYGLTTGTVNLTGNPTFSVSNSSGGGVGTLNLGSLNDGGTPTNITIGSGIVALTASATSLVAGSTINVPANATLNLTAASAWGGAGTVVNVSGGTVNLGATNAIGTVPGAIINITSGTVNGNTTDGVTLAQVNMSGGSFIVNTGANQQISSLTGNAGTVSMIANNLTVGNDVDNLSFTFGGVITSSISGNYTGSLAKSGTGTFTITGANNTQLITEILHGTIVAAANSTVTDGLITGPMGSGVVLVGDGGTANNTYLYLDAPGRSLPNTVYFASGPHGVAGVGGQPGTGEETIGGLNTTGITTFAGDIVFGSGNTGADGTNGAAVIGAGNGGEVDITGNLIANHDNAHTELTVRNLSGTGNAVVKTLGQNNTYAGGTEIDPNVTFVAALSGSTRALGYGPVNFVGGTLAIQGQQASGTQLDNLVTNAGFNQKIIVPVGAASAAAGTTSTIDGSSVLYQSGFVNSLGSTGPTGLNASGLYTSEYNPGVQFQLQPYTDNTALQFKSGNNSSGTLTLASPGEFKTINLLGMNGPANVAVTFNFADGSSETQYLNTQGWYYGQSENVPTGSALSNMQRLAIGGTNTNPASPVANLVPATYIGSVTRSATADVFTEYPGAMYEDDFTLSSSDQTKTLTGISFNASTASLAALGAGTANIMAVSGQTYVLPTTLTTQTYTNNVNVSNANVPSGTINVTGSLHAVMGNNLTMGNTTLSVVSSDTSGSPYSLTLGTLPDTLDTLNTPPGVSLIGSTVGGGPTFNVNNSAGGGTGMLVLGSFDDTDALDPVTFNPIPQTLTKTGSGTLTLTAPAKDNYPSSGNFGGPSLVNGITVNVNAGTLNSNDPTALGTQATVNVTGTLNFGANDNTGTAPVPVTLAALNVAGGTVSVLNAASEADRTVLVITGPNNLAITAGGTVDLYSNDMIVQGGNLATITGELQSGYNNGSWNGLGIRSTTAGTDTTHLTALGVMASTGAAFDGQATSPGDVLIKYTYYGDANLDGKVDASDYSLIDNGYLNQLTGWSNGDFNYDGVINGSDYTLIDNAFNMQGAQLSAETAAPTAQIDGASGASSVPEPTSSVLLGTGVLGILGRRRRR